MPASVTRRTVLQKVRGRTFKVLPQLVNTGFQVLFHSPPGVLFTFPSQYYALSVTKEYLALGGGPPDFPQGSTCLVVLWILLPGRISCTGLSPSLAGFPKTVPLAFVNDFLQSVTPACTHAGLGSSHFARRYSGNRVFFLFLRVLRCFSSPGSLPYVMDWRMDHMRSSHVGFPHSDICGSKDICSSPQLFAAYHVFLRLLVPRHPPCALSCLTIRSNSV